MIQQYQLKPGWTKARMKEVILKRNTGTVCQNKTTGRCSYREGLNHCAVGVFLPDDLCDKLEADKIGGIKTTAVGGPLYQYTKEAEQYLPLDWLGMLALQSAHDAAYEINNIHGFLCGKDGWIDMRVVEAGTV